MGNPSPTAEMVWNWFAVFKCQQLSVNYIRGNSLQLCWWQNLPKKMYQPNIIFLKYLTIKEWGPFNIKDYSLALWEINTKRFFDLQDRYTVPTRFHFRFSYVNSLHFQQKYQLRSPHIKKKKKVHILFIMAHFHVSLTQIKDSAYQYWNS